MQYSSAADRSSPRVPKAPQNLNSDEITARPW